MCGEWDSKEKETKAIRTKSTTKNHERLLFNKLISWHAPKLLDRPHCESKVKITKEQEVEAHSLARNTLGVEGHAGALGWD
jgi:hypothetical protein